MQCTPRHLVGPALGVASARTFSAWGEASLETPLLASPARGAGDAPASSACKTQFQLKTMAIISACLCNPVLHTAIWGTPPASSVSVSCLPGQKRLPTSTYTLQKIAHLTSKNVYHLCCSVGQHIGTSLLLGLIGGRWRAAVLVVIGPCVCVGVCAILLRLFKRKLHMRRPNRLVPDCLETLHRLTQLWQGKRHTPTLHLIEFKRGK